MRDRNNNNNNKFFPHPHHPRSHVQPAQSSGPITDTSSPHAFHTLATGHHLVCSMYYKSSINNDATLFFCSHPTTKEMMQRGMPGFSIFVCGRTTVGGHVGLKRIFSFSLDQQPAVVGRLISTATRELTYKVQVCKKVTTCPILYSL